jgi:hypothetical protein
MSEHAKKSGRRGRLLALVCAFAFVTERVAFAGQIPLLSVSLTKKEYVVGEPLIVTVRLGSPSTPLFRVFSDNEAFARTADLVFVFSGGDGTTVGEIRVDGADEASIDARMRSARKPGEFWECQKVILPCRSERKQALFTPVGLLGPGGWRLRASVLWDASAFEEQEPGSVRRGVRIESGEVAFRTREPAGVDAEAVRLVTCDLRGFFLGTSGGDPEAIRQLLARHPGSTYARYARARLLIDRMGSFWGTKRTGLSPAESEEVSRLIAEALEHAAMPEFAPLADNMLLLRARMQTIRNDNTGAARTLNLILSRFPASDAAETARTWLSNMPQGFSALTPEPLPDPK